MPVGVWRRRHYLPSPFIGVTAIEIGSASSVPGKTIAWALDPTVSWTVLTSDPFGAAGGFGIRWVNGLWLAGGGGGTGGAQSADGMTWSTFANPPLAAFIDSTVYDYAWTGSLWVACGYAGASSAGDIIATSPDLVTWTSRSTAGAAARKIANSGSLLACVGGMGTVTSPDGITWTSRTSGANRSVAWGGGQFVAVGDSGGSGNVIWTSPDGITWTSRSSPFTNGVGFGVEYHSGLYVVVGTNGPSTGAVVITSSDGVTWTAQTTPLDGPYDGTSIAELFAVAYDTITGVWIAAGTDGFSRSGAVTSPDGVTWTYISDKTGFSTQAIAAR